LSQGEGKWKAGGLRVLPRQDPVKTVGECSAVEAYMKDRGWRTTARYTDSPFGELEQAVEYFARNWLLLCNNMPVDPDRFPASWRAPLSRLYDLLLAVL
jgi:hypothetical protein